MLIKWCNLNKKIYYHQFLINFNQKNKKKNKHKFCLLNYIKFSSVFRFFFMKLKKNDLLTSYLDKFLPLNYNFEYVKTISRLNNSKHKKIVVQFPDGIREYNIILNFLFQLSSKRICQILNLGITSYGACCVEDYFAKFLGMCVILHYGHSCLTLIVESFVLAIYVFLEINFNWNTIINIFEKRNFLFLKKTFTLFSTVQYISILQNLKKELDSKLKLVFVYTNKPLSPGEILGCTCVKTNNFSNTMYIGEGRFHLETIVFSNFFSHFFQFNPFFHQLLKIDYNIVETLKERKVQILKSFQKKTNLAVLIGVLGKQNNNLFLKKIKKLISEKSTKVLHVVMCEISFDILNKINYGMVKTWIQNACPRLSTDWNNFFIEPILNSYEACVLFCSVKWKKHTYPLTYYSYKGEYWTMYATFKSFFS
nr:diphthamide biosynthesis protein 1 [Cryptomonas paramecium]